MKTHLLGFSLVGLALFTGCQAASSTHMFHAQAIGSTQNVPVNQVEDAAFWIHPTNPSKSLLLVANKTHGMELHNPAGILLKHYEDKRELAGVDVLYDFSLNGENVDLVIAASPGEKDGGVRVWRVNAEKQRITEVTADKAIPVLDGTDPLGIVACHAGGEPAFFVTNELGLIEEYTLVPKPDGSVTAEKLSAITLPGKVKAGVADDRAGVVYFASEKAGIFEMSTDPANHDAPKLIIPINQNGMTADLTGITLYEGKGDAGYLIVVSQKPKGEESTLFLYNRATPHAFVGQIVIDESSFGGVYSSSGIAVTNAALSRDFPGGILALKNRFNPSASEDYKLFSWQTLARQAHLMVDTAASPRAEAKNTVRPQSIRQN